MGEGPDCFPNRLRSWMPPFFSSPPSFSPSGRPSCWDGPFFRGTAAFFASRAAVLLSRTAVLESGRPSFFPRRRLCFPSCRLRKTAGRPSARGVVFVPERLSFFAKAHPGVPGGHLCPYGRCSLPVHGGPSLTA